MNRIRSEDIIKKMLSQHNVSGLYIIATPIGNLFDITIRALYVLSCADVIIAEDTRVIKKLLNFYDIHKKLISYHSYNEKDVTPKLLEFLKNGQKVALVSDAGTPLISDPGYEIVNACIRNGIFITYIPGACSAVAALVCAGLPTQSFCFLGFVPTKTSDIRRLLSQIKDCRHTVIVFETANRLLSTINYLAGMLDANRPIVIAKELTKLHESFIRGTIGEIKEKIPTTIRGEITVIIGPDCCCAQEIDDKDLIAIIKQHMETASLKQAVSTISAQFNIPKNKVYKLALRTKLDCPKED